MALIESEKKLCCKVIKASVPDGHGAEVTRYVDGRSFSAIVTPVTGEGTKAIGGQTESCKKVKLFYPKDVSLDLNDIIRVKKDSKVYKITQEEDKPANAASIQYCLTYAEEWSIPDE